jgi:hypothetical protein
MFGISSVSFATFVENFLICWISDGSRGMYKYSF